MYAWMWQTFHFKMIIIIIMLGLIDTEKLYTFDIIIIIQSSLSFTIFAGLKSSLLLENRKFAQLQLYIDVHSKVYANEVYTRSKRS